MVLRGPLNTRGPGREYACDRLLLFCIQCGLEKVANEVVLTGALHDHICFFSEQCELRGSVPCV